MEIGTILELLNEYGPVAFMFAFGIWGIYMMITQMKADRERSEKKVDLMMDKFIEALDKRDEIKKVEHDKGLEYRKDVTVKCDQYAKEILTQTGADHVAIYDYCNGSQNNAGIPFLHFSVIAEKTESGHCKTLFMSKKADLNTLGVFLIELEKEQHITIKNIKKDKDKYPELEFFMNLNKKHKGMFANIVGINSSLGFISVVFNHNKKVDYDQLEKIVFNYAQKISNMLDYSNINS